MTVGQIRFLKSCMLTQEVKDETVKVALGRARLGLGSQIIRNVLFGALQYALLVPIPFIMTPLILREIGVAGYGTWAVFLAINGLTSLADLGLMGTLSKFAVEYYAKNDIPGLSRLLNSGLALFLSLDFLIITALWVASPWLASCLFHGTPIPKVQLVVLLHFFLIVVASNILTQLFASVTTGLQRLDLTNMISTANVVLSATIGGVLLVHGLGLRGLVYGYAGSSLLTVIAYVVTIRRLLPHIRWNFLQFDKVEARKMFGFSLRLYVTQAAVAVHNQVEKVFLGILIGVAPVGWYDIASGVALKVRGGVGFMLVPVLPAASELNALGDQLRMRELYYRTHKYLGFIGIPVVCYVIAISHRFAELWLGPNLRLVALPLSVLLVVNFFNLATGPGFMIFAGCGNLRPGIQSATLAMGLNVILSLGLIWKFGFAGAVMGTAASLIFGSAYFMFMFHRQTGYSVARVLREAYLKPILCSVPVLTVILAIRPAKDLLWFGLVGIGLVFGVVYSVAILLSGFFDEYDWTKAEGVIPLIRRARRMVRVA